VRRGSWACSRGGCQYEINQVREKRTKAQACLRMERVEGQCASGKDRWRQSKVRTGGEHHGGGPRGACVWQKKSRQGALRVGFLLVLSHRWGKILSGIGERYQKKKDRKGRCDDD